MPTEGEELTGATPAGSGTAEGGKERTEPAQGDGKKQAAAQRAPDITKMSREELEAQLSQRNQDLASARRVVENREAEAKRVHAKYEEALKDLGDEKALQEYKQWQANRQKEEEERQRKEGELEKIIAARDKGIVERDQRIERLQTDLFRSRIDRELGDAATRLDAVSLTQVSRLFGDPSDWVINDKGDLVHKTKTHPDTGNSLSPQALLELEKAGANGNLFRAALQSGSGSAHGGSGGGGNGAARVTIRMIGGKLSPEEQAKYERATKAIREGTMRPENLVIDRERSSLG